MRKALLAGLCVLFVSSIAAAQAMAAKGGASSPEDSRARWVAAANAKDAAGIAALYTDDAMLMPPNTAAVKSRTAIQAHWKGMLDQGAHDITLAKVAGGQSGDWAYEAGTYGAMFGTSPDKGKYLLTLKRARTGSG